MIEKLDKFIEDHIVMDELDGVERTLVEFNFNDWIRFKRENFEDGEEIEIKEKLMDVVPTVKSDAWKKKPGPKKGTKSTQESQLYDSGVKKKVNKQIIEFIRDNCLAEDDESLVALIKNKFRVDTTINTIKWWMSHNGISRRRMKKEEDDDYQEPKEQKKILVPKPEKKKSYPGKRKPRIIFPVEMEGFVKNNLSLSNRDLAEKVNIQFDLDMDCKKICDYMRVRNIKRTGVFKEKKQTEGEGVQDKRKISKYPDEMKEFIRSRMEMTTNQGLCDLINEKWNLGITMDRVKNYMKYNQLKRVNIIRSPRKTAGKPKIYTDEVIQFLKDNINNFSNKELCEELESRFNIKTNFLNMASILGQRGIKRDIQPEVDPEIEDFILKSKIKDAYILKDKIIEKFEKVIPTRKIINIMNKRTDLPGESVKEEVDRIEAKRVKLQKDPFDDEVDELDLDN